MNKKYTVLIIDDKTENLQYLSTILEKENYIIKATTNPDFAISSCKIQAPDLILLDIKMPVKDGFEICKILKSNETLKEIPIIFISALDDIKSKVKAFEEGGVDYITKPFEKEEVLARVKTQLNLFQSKQTISKLLEQQDFFLKKIIHEMNTPLSIISLNIDNLQRQIGPKEQFEAIKASTKTLSSIYNDLYYLRKKEQPKKDIKKIDLVKFLSSRIIFFDEMASVKTINIDLDIHDEFDIFMDEYELERIIDNTLSNAIKYSNINSDISISMEIKDDLHLLKITDNGIGIEDTSTIFTPYFQENKKSLGLGLGLNIVKNICDENKIEIKVNSSKKETSFIYIFNQNQIKSEIL